MTTADILKKLESLCSDQTKKIFIRHGAREPFYGVKVQDLKKIVREVKKERSGKNDPGAARHQLALELTALIKSTALSIGKLSVDMGGTACKVPDAPDYIRKIEQMGRIGQKRKTALC